MKKYILHTMQLLLIGAFVISSCNKDDNNPPCADLSSTILSETRTVSDFHSISLSGIGDILLTQGPVQELRIETHKEVLDRLDTRVINDELQIELDGCITGQVQRFDIYITIPEIKRISMEGVGTLTTQNDLDLDNLEIIISGVGDLTLTGITDNLDVRATGVGNVHAFDLVTDICDIELSGVGNVEVQVVDELNVTISGSGNVYYLGNPTINTTITGTGNLINSN